WAIIQPLMTTIVFTVVFGNLARITTADAAGPASGQNAAEAVRIPGFLFYMSATICWSYFAQTVKTTANTFLSNYRVFGKVYFPRLSIPISGALSNIISFGIRFVMFLCFWTYYVLRGDCGIHLSVYILLLPLLLLQLILMGIAFGLLVSSVTTKYRDLIQMLDFGIQLWQYATPVAYGLSLIPERYMDLYMLNPVTMVVVTFRYAFFGVGYFNAGYYALGWAVTLITLFFGLRLFGRVERTFMDTI
nr:ABC transporter permease [Lachnospiraceae bacterium]